MKTVDFLRELFGDDLEAGAHVVAFCDRRASFETSVASASETIARLDRESASDVYFGCALQPRVQSGRGTAQTALAIGGLWADIDVANSHHKKSGLPQSEEVASAILREMPLSPSVVLSTGGGMHAWWILREPWYFSTPDEREEAHLSLVGWQDLLRTIAAKRSCSVDATHDLTRVLRTPGTTNKKYGSIVVATTTDGPRYNPIDFEPWRASARSAYSGVEPKVVAGLRLDPEADPPMSKLEFLISMDAEFKRAWSGKRQFPSQSERDLSLAARAIDAGWTDQEVVNLMISSRRRLGGAPKMRADYYARTIATVRASKRIFERLVDSTHDVDRAADANAEHVARGEEVSEKTSASSSDETKIPTVERDVVDSRSALLADVSATIGVRVVSLVRYQGDPASYRLVLEQGSTDLGGVDGVLNGRQFRARVADVTGRIIPMMKDAQWSVVAQALLTAAEDVEMPSTGTPEAQLRTVLETVIAGSPPVRDRDVGANGGVPWIENGRLWFHSSQVYQPTRAILGQPGWSFRKWCEWMRACGASEGQVWFHGARGGKPRNRRFWSVPVDSIVDLLGERPDSARVERE